MAMTGKNRIMIYAPKNDGTYVVGYRIAYAEGEMRARYRHRSQSSRLQVVAAQAVVALAA